MISYLSWPTISYQQQKPLQQKDKQVAYLYKKTIQKMKNILNQYLNKTEQFDTVESKEKAFKKKKVKMRENSGMLEVVEKTFLAEDGRQLLND